MKILSDKERFVHASIRIPQHVKSELEEEADRKRTTWNSLVNQALVKHITHDKMMEHIGSVTLGKPLFSKMISTIDPNTMETFGLEVGSRRVKESFKFFGIEPNIPNLITHHFSPIAAYSGWYQLNPYQVSGERKLILEHDFGLSWSAFLRGFYVGVLKSMGYSEPRIEADDELVTIHY
jgi:hypothetical protein